MNIAVKAVPTMMAVLLVGLPTAKAFGQRFVDERALDKVPAVRVTTFISGEGDCAPDPDVLKTEAELVLRRSGIAVAEDSIHDYHVDLVILRTRSGLCAVAYGFQLRVSLLGSFLQHFSTMGVMTGPHYNLQDRLRSVTNQNATELANELLKARGE